MAPRSNQRSPLKGQKGTFLTIAEPDPPVDLTESTESNTQSPATSDTSSASPLFKSWWKEKELMDRKEILECIIPLLEKIQHHFKVACAGGAVEWIFGHTSDFNDIDIFILSKKNEAFINAFLTKIVDCYVPMQSHQSRYSPRNHDVKILGYTAFLMKHHNINIAVQFIRTECRNINKYLTEMDLPNACGSALTLSQGNIKLIRVIQPEQFFVINKKTGFGKQADAIAKLSDAADKCLSLINYQRFRKYCIRLHCKCLRHFPYRAPSKIIQRCKLFTYTRPTSEVDLTFGNMDELLNYLYTDCL